MRPTIGITTPVDADRLALLFLVMSVRLAGGKPVRLHAKLPYRELEVDGLLLGGGSDIFPELYQAKAKEGGRYDRQRDELEVYWLKLAREKGLPVLAICRGAQMMNVVHGGSLHMDVHLAYENAHYPSGPIASAFYRKRVNLRAGSRFRELMGVDRLLVNSIHKQAIARLGDHLEAVAQERNGVVQAIEDPTRPFYLGVQFHPEFLIYRKLFRRIFRTLVECARSG